MVTDLGPVHQRQVRPDGDEPRDDGVFPGVLDGHVDNRPRLALERAVHLTRGHLGGQPDQERALPGALAARRTGRTTRPGCARRRRPPMPSTTGSGWISDAGVSTRRRAGGSAGDSLSAAASTAWRPSSGSGSGGVNSRAITTTMPGRSRRARRPGGRARPCPARPPRSTRTGRCRPGGPRRGGRARGPVRRGRRSPGRRGPAALRTTRVARLAAGAGERAVVGTGGDLPGRASASASDSPRSRRWPRPTGARSTSGSRYRTRGHAAERPPPPGPAGRIRPAKRELLVSAADVLVEQRPVLDRCTGQRATGGHVHRPATGRHLRRALPVSSNRSPRGQGRGRRGRRRCRTRTAVRESTRDSLSVMEREGLLSSWCGHWAFHGRLVPVTLDPAASRAPMMRSNAVPGVRACTRRLKASGAALAASCSTCCPGRWDSSITGPGTAQRRRRMPYLDVKVSPFRLGRCRAWSRGRGGVWSAPGPAFSRAFRHAPVDCPQCGCGGPALAYAVRPADSVLARASG